MSQAPETTRMPAKLARGSLPETDRRRSERLLITIPIQVEGMDQKGERFSEATRTLVINRQGARITLKRAVCVGAVLQISTMGGRRSGKFRIVGPTQPPTGEGGEWGIECQEARINIWGIGFPPPAPGDGACAALLECRRCHEIKLCQLSMIEHEVLEKTGLLVKECEICGRSTSWSFKEPSVALASDDGSTTLPPDVTLSAKTLASQRRTHNRVALQLPIRLRGFYGSEEFTRTENVSRTGLCFITDRNYEVGEVILVTCPYEKNGHNIEMRGHVVRRREMQGTGRKIYGVSYER